MTFYDASYIVAVESAGARLVTEDGNLLAVARNYVGTTTYSDLERMLSESRS